MNLLAFPYAIHDRARQPQRQWSLKPPRSVVTPRTKRRTGHREGDRKSALSGFAAKEQWKRRKSQVVVFEIGNLEAYLDVTVSYMLTTDQERANISCNLRSSERGFARVTRGINVAWYFNEVAYSSFSLPQGFTSRLLLLNRFF